MTHAIPDAGPTSEPVLIAHAVTTALSGLVAAGWVTIPDPTINIIGDAVAFVLATVAVVVARGRVTPANGKATITDYEQWVVDIVRDEIDTYVARQPGT